MKSKYKAKKVEVNGITFDSKKEANRYQELRLLERAGEIQNLEIQVKFPLIPAQYEEELTYTPKKKTPKTVRKLIEREVSYIADFVYEKDGKVVVEDVKGYRMAGAYALFVIKRKLMLYVHGIKVKEV